MPFALTNNLVYWVKQLQVVGIMCTIHIFSLYK